MNVETQLTNNLNENRISKNLEECVKWATIKPDQVEKKKGTTISQQKKEEQEKEKNWGNYMIQQTNNGQWTTLFGQGLVFEVLKMRGENPRKVIRKDGFEPDWETDEYIYMK